MTPFQRNKLLVHDNEHRHSDDDSQSRKREMRVQ
jgi:hypothetical protein